MHYNRKSALQYVAELSAEPPHYETPRTQKPISHTTASQMAFHLPDCLFHKVLAEKKPYLLYKPTRTVPGNWVKLIAIVIDTTREELVLQLYENSKQSSLLVLRKGEMKWG